MASTTHFGNSFGASSGPGAGSSVMTAYAKGVKNCRNLLDSGEYNAAISLLRDLLKQSPQDVHVLRMLGHALMMLDSRDEAVRHLAFALKLDPNNVDVLCEFSTLMRRMDELRKAHELVDKAIKLSPAHPRAVMSKARLLQSHGQSQRACELVDKALEVNRDPTLLTMYGQLCRELKNQEAGVDAIRKGLEDPGLARASRQDLLNVLGHLLDSLKEYDSAFDCFQKSNAMGPEATHLDVDLYLKRWSAQNFEKIPVSNHDGSRAVFIVGMPRSGTTLTEQIIASHAVANGIGESILIDSMAIHRELDAFGESYVEQAGKMYLDMLDTKFPDQSVVRVCDKMPENYYYAGLISKILPGSHVIHCKRNSIDTCLSIYFQRFGPKMTYATDMEHTAHQFITYGKVIKHLTDELGVTMHDAVYEETTSNPEASIRGMLEHIGLPFDEACLNFHKSKKSVHTASASQIRQPMYTSSSQRWKNYEKHIGPMIEILGPVLGE